MATTEQKKQMLLESFDILKDSWEKKWDPIQKIIVNMAVLDMPTAIEMWLYIIERNKKLFPNNSYPLFEGIIHDMNKKMDMKKIAKTVFAVPILVNYLFKENYDVSYNCEELLSCLIIEGDNSQLLTTLQLVASNPHLGESRDNIGAIVSEAIKRIPDVKDYGQKVPESTKEVLYDFVSHIEDKQERAEAMVALLDLDDLD